MGALLAVLYQVKSGSMWKLLFYTSDFLSEYAGTCALRNQGRGIYGVHYSLTGCLYITYLIDVIIVSW